METEIVMGSVMGVFFAALIGLLIGAVAKWLLPGRDPGGWLATCMVGLAGSWLASGLLALLGLHGEVLKLVAAVLGAMALLLLWRRVQQQRQLGR
ncbi:GlsB/YeaQ/YmgE family stress response membrane protein [Chitinibacter sp. ZOR0017]|uniref:GlsB/YeaQ/YmgE family stress response membrane protein n=1 Tax=Chitinibacter sp. ZOR0017 TaxID=1339254 RepID=UPI00069119A4|nr:GlsB/YeaQ/YmgE family stress response membrane protein [Chitinibacter sp. ZOR0017]